jgi:bacteriocin biosynthesis cyclodehydratase domain-containing protein
MIAMSDRLYCYPWFRAMQDGDAYLFEYGGTVIRVTGRSAVALLSALLPRLDGARTVEEIQRDLSAWDGAEIRQALSVLLSNGIIAVADHVPDMREDERLLLALMGPPTAESPVQASQVGVAGSGSLAQAVRQLCEQAGVRGVRALAWDDTVPEPCDLAIAAADGRDLPQLDVWNRRMLAGGQSWLLVLPFDGLYGAVGPLFIPGETSCYACLQIRRRSVLEDPELARAYDDRPATRPMGGAVTAVQAGLAVHMGLRWLAYRDARIAGVLYAVRLIPQPAVSGHEVFPVPRCPACRSAGLPTPSPWYPGARRRVLSP